MLSIIIPLISIWLIAVHGAARFKTYAHSIKNSKDGDSLNSIANGLLWLIVYIVFLPMTNAIESLALNTRYLLPSVFLGNHIPLVFALISVFLLFKGSKNLTGIVTSKLTATRRSEMFSVLGAIFFIGFTWHFYSVVPTLEPVNGIPRFAIPVQALLFTYVLPHIIFWTAGLLACRNLAHYALQTKGTIYKSLFNDLYKGILLVYVSIFMSQIFIISTISYANFNVGVALIYGLLLLSTTGFVLVAKGANKLKLLEQQ